MTELVLQGPIPPSGVVPLLQAVGIGRQTCAVRLFDGGAMLGQLWLRAGKVLAAEFGAIDGPDALRKIVSHRNGTFSVSTEILAQLPEPLGDLRAMLKELGSDQISLLRGLDRRPMADTGVQSLPTLAVDPPSQAPMAPSAPKLTPATPISREASPALAPAPQAPVAQAPAPQAPVAQAPAPQAPAPQAPAPQATVALPRSLSQSLGAPRAPIASPVEAEPALPEAPEARPARAVGASRPTERTIPMIAVASAKGGVGKTTISLNTAVALARRGMRVTLVDADPSGGVSAAINAQERRTVGAFDVLCGALRFADVLVVSRMSSLRVVPSGGLNRSVDQIENAQMHRGGWQLLIREAARDSDIVIVDTPAGAFGSTRALFGCVTHVLGVLQAEPIAMRVANHFQRALTAVSPPPRMLGYVVNMFDSRSAASASVLQDACRILPAGHVFETPIPRTNVINEASMRGVVPAQADLATAPAIAWAFEQLAAEMMSRLELERPVEQLDESPLF
jgi:chromosome partitioning protein